MKILFMRHAESEYNVKGWENSDPSILVHITPKGKRQAASAAKILKNVKLDHAFTSELIRTIETARIATRGRSIPTKIDPRINEWNGGFEGMPPKERLQMIDKETFKFKCSNGESWKDLKKRVISFIEYLKNQNFDSVLVVAHGCILQMAKGYFENLSDEEMYSTHIQNCQIMEFNMNDDS
jgi:broad specificity phosphatase PhoE